MAAVAAMIVGVSYEQTVASIGHDSTEEEPFLDKEIIIYLLVNGFVMSQDLSPPGDYDTETMLRWIARMGLGEKAAIITVKSMKHPPPTEHVILWTGKDALDPNPDVTQPLPLSTYEITGWAPIGHLLNADYETV